MTKTSEKNVKQIPIKSLLSERDINIYYSLKEFIVNLDVIAQKQFNDKTSETLLKHYNSWAQFVNNQLEEKTNIKAFIKDFCKSMYRFFFDYSPYLRKSALIVETDVEDKKTKKMIKKKNTNKVMLKDKGYYGYDKSGVLMYFNNNETQNIKFVNVGPCICHEISDEPDKQPYVFPLAKFYTELTTEQYCEIHNFKKKNEKGEEEDDESRIDSKIKTFLLKARLYVVCHFSKLLYMCMKTYPTETLTNRDVFDEVMLKIDEKLIPRYDIMTLQDNLFDTVIDIAPQIVNVIGRNKEVLKKRNVDVSSVPNGDNISKCLNNQVFKNTLFDITKRISGVAQANSNNPVGAFQGLLGLMDDDDIVSEGYKIVDIFTGIMTDPTKQEQSSVNSDEQC